MGPPSCFGCETLTYGKVLVLERVPLAHELFFPGKVKNTGSGIFTSWYLIPLPRALAIQSSMVYKRIAIHREREIITRSLV
jgi:hypothetical protein